jgi:hypothetical protein
MDRQAAYRLAQQELESLKEEPFEALLDRLDEARSAHVSDAGHQFLVESTVSWAVPTKTLRLAVTVDAASPQRFERVEESALLTCPDEGKPAEAE